MKPSDVLNTELAPNQGVMAVINESGDTRTTWDRTKPEEVQSARQAFALLKKNGYLAYRVTGREGRTGEILHEFDPDVERILFAPQMAGGSRGFKLGLDGFELGLLIAGLLVVLVGALAHADTQTKAPPQVKEYAVDLPGGAPIQMTVGPGKAISIRFSSVAKDDLASVVTKFFAGGPDGKNDKKKFAKVVAELNALLAKSDSLTVVLTTEK